jgi:GxxExxY protein
MDGTSGHRLAPIRRMAQKRPQIEVFLEENLSRSVIGGFFDSYNKLGYGFSEHVCIGALCVELRYRGHRADREVAIPVHYDGEIIGSYRADLVIDNKLLVETKAEPQITVVHEKQLRNYLACTTFELGLLLCYGVKPQFKRMIHTLDRKTKVANQWQLQSHRSDQCEANALDAVSLATRPDDEDAALR